MSASAFELETREFPWWIPLMQGIASVIFGLLLLFVREEFLSIIVVLLGLYWLISGIFNIISIFIDKSAWGWKLIVGILGVIAGLIVIQHPLWGSFVLPAVAAILLGIQGLIVGIIGLVFALKGGGWGAGILAVVSIIIGLLLLFNAAVAGQLLVILLGIVMIIGGIAAIIFAFQVK
ncbi:MAG: HdeD family acid-resistance protein [Anaerolineales bacterium]|jgi:uncharacterized membrane protein HdeD (DUF308 family)